MPKRIHRRTRTPTRGNFIVFIHHFQGGHKTDIIGLIEGMIGFYAIIILTFGIIGALITAWSRTKTFLYSIERRFIHRFNVSNRII